MPLGYLKTTSPIGTLYLVADNLNLHALVFDCGWDDYKKTNPSVIEAESSISRRAVKQLNEYFSGQRREFDLPYRFDGTEFQKKVWSALTEIPFGKTVSYKQQAEAIGNRKAVRAVGGTNGRNPLPIILPCHRVVGQSGQLTGYGGGIDKKKFLLKLEGLSF